MSNPCNWGLIFETTTKKLLICCQVFLPPSNPHWEAYIKLTCSECPPSLWIWVTALEIFHLSFSFSEWLFEGSSISSLSYLFTACHYSSVCFVLFHFLDHYSQVQQRLPFCHIALLLICLLKLIESEVPHSCLVFVSSL